MKKRLGALWPGWLLLLCQLGVVAVTLGSGAPSSNSAGTGAAATSAAPEMTTQDVDAFLAGLVPAQIDREDIAGAVVVVVKDGKILIGRGYGFADVEKRTPVSASDTLFRPGSTSKLFTWTAVMQLVEQDKLDLDRDVNTYIDFNIPEAFGKPITLRDIMTHTPGLEESGKDLFVSGPERMQPLGSYLASHIPHRIYAPGTTPAYSNYATALAGYIVQRVSGRPFADYIEEFVTRPLGMEHSTFLQPLPKSLEPLMSKGYRLGSGKPEPFEFVNATPAGALSSTGTDMARFAIAHLQDGRFEDKRILKPETARLMHVRQRGTAESMNAMALGFYEESRNGLRIIGHAGDTNWFHSDLHLIPEKGVGFYVSYNSAGRADVSPRTVLWEKFLDRYFPYTPPASAPVATAAADARVVNGSYILSRRSESNFLRLLYVLVQLAVTPDKDGAIQVNGLKGFNGQPKLWREVAPLTYREVNGQDQLVFQRNAAGRLQMTIPYPFFVFTKPAWFESRGILLPLAIVTGVLLLLTLILWPVGGLTRRHYGRKLDLSPGARRLRLWARIVCVIDVAVIAILAGIVVVSLQNVTLLNARLDPWLRLLQGLGILGTLGALVALANAVSAWSTRGRGVWSRLGETLIALACLGFVWLVLVGRLLHVGPEY